MRHFDRQSLETIKSGMPITELLAQRGIAPVRTADGWRCRCPIHDGSNPTSFWIDKTDSGWHCFAGCGGGDVVNLLMRMDSLDFREACSGLSGGRLPASPSFRRPSVRDARSKRPLSRLPALEPWQVRQMKQMCYRLTSDSCLMEELAVSRKWEPPTISALAHPCSTSPFGVLGWVDRSRHTGDLCFLYPHSVKLRTLFRDTTGQGWKWHLPDGSKLIRWLWPGWPWNGRELWREDRIFTSPIKKTSCFITEGEPDAVAAIDDHIESTFRTVLAIPSATFSRGLGTRLPALLSGLEVVLIPDCDAAGKESTANLTEILRGTAKSLRVVNPLPAL